MNNVSEQNEIFKSWLLLREKIASSVPVYLKQIERKAITSLLEERIVCIQRARHQLEMVKDNSGGEPKFIGGLKLSLLDLESKIEGLREGLSLPFELVVVGMGKVGKSSLINALITRRVADMDILPKTWKTDLFVKSIGTNAKVIYRDGSIQEIGIDDAKRIVDKEEELREKSEDVVYEKYKELSKVIASIEDKEQLKRELFHKYLYRSNVREIHWPVSINNLESILEDFVVVDTPGLWQVNGGDQREDISDYYHQADGVIWVLDASTLSASKPKKMLDELDFALNQAGVKRFENIIAVLNRIDSAVPDGDNEKIERIVVEAKKIFGERFVDVVPFSARKALKSLDDKGEIDAHHKKLLGIIKSCFYNEGMNSRLAIKDENSSALVAASLEAYNSYKQKLICDNQKRLDVLSVFNDNLVELKNEIHQSLADLVLTLSDRIKNNIENNISEFLEIEEPSEQNKFFMTRIVEQQSLRKHFVDFRLRYADRCTALRNRGIKISRFTEYKFADVAADTCSIINKVESISDIKLSVNVNNDSEVGGVLLAGLGVVLLANPIGLVLGAIAHSTGITRWMSLAYNGLKMKRVFNAHKDKILAEMSGKIEESLELMIGNIESQVNSVREDSFSSLHGSSSNYESLIFIGNDLDAIASKRIEAPSLINLLLWSDKHDPA
ncbi:MAG: dynamin family protein [Moraxellaceae bacterium]|nr:dynamin family protein [Pseudomonadales bacterium]MCP5175385.1 dynamin family protein [Moraxellaceae bacterium]MCP5177110.1 dynamin family protein [Moraxellaceae bacterium]